ncbi:MAG: hypothetical protein HY601_03285 [Candidatus Omnitrophica bacterium]|nr:hypothetical protein [Candidatus Omnitrophota bacterium]
MMVPWPVAALALGYGLLAALSAAALWQRPGVWPAAWLALSAAAMLGLPLLKPWARMAALAGLWWLVASLLVLAGVLVGAARPLDGLLVTCAAGGLLIPMRYLRRPQVKAWFGQKVLGERGEGER